MRTRPIYHLMCIGVLSLASFACDRNKDDKNDAPPPPPEFDPLVDDGTQGGDPSLPFFITLENGNTLAEQVNEAGELTIRFSNTDPGLEAIHDFQCKFAKTLEFARADFEVCDSSASHSVTGIEPGEGYSFAVAAVNQVTGARTPEERADFVALTEDSTSDSEPETPSEGFEIRGAEQLRNNPVGIVGIELVSDQDWVFSCLVDQVKISGCEANRFAQINLNFIDGPATLTVIAKDARGVEVARQTVEFCAGSQCTPPVNPASESTPGYPVQYFSQEGINLGDAFFVTPPEGFVLESYSSTQPSGLQDFLEVYAGFTGKCSGGEDYCRIMNQEASFKERTDFLLALNHAKIRASSGPTVELIINNLGKNSEETRISFMDRESAGDGKRCTTPPREVAVRSVDLINDRFRSLLSSDIRMSEITLARSCQVQSVRGRQVIVEFDVHFVDRAGAVQEKLQLIHAVDVSALGSDNIFELEFGAVQSMVDLARATISKIAIQGYQSFDPYSNGSAYYQPSYEPSYQPTSYGTGGY